jgi:hypothetical protein
MATEYTLNGFTTSIAPVSQRWEPLVLATDHNLAPIYGALWNINLMFDVSTIVEGREWLDATSSGGSVNGTVLDRYQTDYTDLSGVYLQVEGQPDVLAGHFAPFSIVIKGVSSV